MLNSYGLSYTVISKVGKGLIGLSKEFIFREITLAKVIKKIQPDMMLGIAGPFIAPIGKIFNIPTIIFTDTENAIISNKIAFPFASTICIPNCYKLNHGNKQSTYIRYNGYHELTYLHPKYFKPNPKILDTLGVKKNDKYVIMRFISWGAAHDIKHKGLYERIKRKAINEFQKYSKVFITSEYNLPYDLKKYYIKIPSREIHSAIFYSSLVYGESATMASESAILGTPAIYIDDVGRGYTTEQEKIYKAVINYKENIEDQKRSIMMGIEILKNDSSKYFWTKKRNNILNDKIDVTLWIYNLICKKINESKK